MVQLEALPALQPLLGAYTGQLLGWPPRLCKACIAAASQAARLCRCLACWGNLQMAFPMSRLLVVQLLADPREVPTLVVPL